MITAHTPKYNADGTIDLIVKFPWLSAEVPFCADPNDSEQYGRDLHASAIAGHFGPVAAYVAPVVVQKPISVTPWQIRKALNQIGLRSAVESAVSASSDQSLKDGWEFATEFVENSPFVVSMCAALGKTDAERHELFVLAKSL